jgi:hypothetical protein
MKNLRDFFLIFKYFLLLFSLFQFTCNCSISITAGFFHFKNNFTLNEKIRNYFTLNNSVRNSTENFQIFFVEAHHSNFSIKFKLIFERNFVIFAKTTAKFLPQYKNVSSSRLKKNKMRMNFVLNYSIMLINTN